MKYVRNLNSYLDYSLLPHDSHVHNIRQTIVQAIPCLIPIETSHDPLKIPKGLWGPRILRNPQLRLSSQQVFEFKVRAWGLEGLDKNNYQSSDRRDFVPLMV